MDLTAVSTQPSTYITSRARETDFHAEGQILDLQDVFSGNPSYHVKVREMKIFFIVIIKMPVETAGQKRELALEKSQNISGDCSVAGKLDPIAAATESLHCTTSRKQ